MAQRKHAKRIKRAVADSSSGLQSLIDSAEELLESMKDQQGAVAAQLREKLSDTIRKTRDRLDDFDARRQPPRPLTPPWDLSAMIRGAAWPSAPLLFWQLRCCCAAAQRTEDLEE
jgi:hypothetical protein